MGKIVRLSLTPSYLKIACFYAHIPPYVVQDIDSQKTIQEYDDSP